MTVRHITSADNVDADGRLIDATVARHGTIRGSHVDSLAGLVDPTTHLNADFADHELGECVIAAELEVGAELTLDEHGQFAHARPRPDARRSLGPVDQGARRNEWLDVLRERRG